MTAGTAIRHARSDHGNDPSFKGTDQCREYVPLLVYRPGKPGRILCIRHGFYDIAQSLAMIFGLPPMPRGISFIEREALSEKKKNPPADGNKDRLADR